MKKIYNFSSIIIAVILLSACASKKEIVYFSDIKINDIDSVKLTPTKLQINDVVNVQITSDNPEVSLHYNLQQASSNTNTLGVTMQGYLVAMDGTITIPTLGKVAADQLTLIELENKVAEKLKNENHLSKPTVSARLLNGKFTILGEVSAPGTYTFTEQNITLLQALGYAGDLTINGKRENILLIREENHQKTYINIDLTSKKWFESPYYYVKPNDVIYVTPNGPKVKSAGYVGNLGTFVSLVSFTLSTFLTILVLSK